MWDHHSYLGHRIIIDVNDLVQVLDNNWGDIFQLLEVKLSVSHDVTVERYWCQVTDGNLFNNMHTHLIVHVANWQIIRPQPPLVEFFCTILDFHDLSALINLTVCPTKADRSWSCITFRGIWYNNSWTILLFFNSNLTTSHSIRHDRNSWSKANQRFQTFPTMYSPEIDQHNIGHQRHELLKTYEL